MYAYRFLSLLFVALGCYGQAAVRIDPWSALPLLTSSGTALIATPGSAVSLCSTLSSPCSSPTTTFTGATGLTQCPISMQATLPGSNSCTNVSGSDGRFGFWVLGGATYYYTFTPPGGAVQGPYPISAGSSFGSQSVETTLGTGLGYLLNSGSSLAEQTVLGSRIGIGLPVPYLTPSVTRPIALDLFPHGNAGDFESNAGVAWSDYCNADVNATSNFSCMRTGIRVDGSILLGPIAFGANTVGNVLMMPNGGRVGVNMGMVQPGAELEVRNAKTTAMNSATAWNTVGLRIDDNSAAGAGVGGGVVFAGNYVGTTEAHFAGIAGVKEANDNTKNGDLVLSTTLEGLGYPTEKVRITAAGHVGYSTYAPPKLSGCGSGSSVNAGSTDVSGTVVVGTSAAACTVTFYQPFARLPQIQITAWNGTVTPSGKSVSGFVVAASAGAVFDYHVDGY